MKTRADLIKHAVKTQEKLIGEAEKQELAAAEILRAAGMFKTAKEARKWLADFREKWAAAGESKTTLEERREAEKAMDQILREILTLELEEGGKLELYQALSGGPTIKLLREELERLKEEIGRLRRRQVGLVWWPGSVIDNIQAKPGTAANLAKKAKEMGDRALAADFEDWELSGDFGLSKLTLFELRVMGGIFAKMNPDKPAEPVTAGTWADFWRACGALEADREIWRSDTQHLHKAFTGLLGKPFKTFASRKRYDKEAKREKYELQRFVGTLFSYSPVYRDLETGELKKLEEGELTPEEEDRLRPEIRIYPQGLLALAYLKYRRGLPGDLYESIRERLGEGKKVAAHHLKYAFHLARHRAEREVIKTNVYALTNELGLTWIEKGCRRGEAIKTIEELSAIYLDMGFLAEPVKITGDQVEEKLNPDRFPHIKQFKAQEAKRLAAGRAKTPRKERKARKKG